MGQFTRASNEFGDFLRGEAARIDCCVGHGFVGDAGLRHQLGQDGARGTQAHGAWGAQVFSARYCGKVGGQLDDYRAARSCLMNCRGRGGVEGLGGAERDNALVASEQAEGLVTRGLGQARVTSHDEGAHVGTQAFLDGVINLEQGQARGLGEQSTDRGFTRAGHSDEDDEAHTPIPMERAGSASSEGSTGWVPGFAMPSRRTKRKTPRRTFLSESMMCVSSSRDVPE